MLQIPLAPEPGRYTRRKMKKVHYALAGFVAYYFVHIINYFHAYIVGAPQLINKSLVQLIVIVLLMGLPVALLGALIGLVFKLIQGEMLGLNIYIQSIFFFILTNALFFIPKGAHAFMSPDFFFSSLYSIPGGVIFIVTLQKISKNKEPQKETA